MQQAPASPLLTLYRRDGCHLCDEARQLLQVELENRGFRGETVPRLREVDIDADPELGARYQHRIPVLAVGDAELELVTSGFAIRRFLERTLPALA
jgi:hypothetical protein